MRHTQLSANDRHSFELTEGAFLNSQIKSNGSILHTLYRGENAALCKLKTQPKLHNIIANHPTFWPLILTLLVSMMHQTACLMSCGEQIHESA